MKVPPLEKQPMERTLSKSKSKSGSNDVEVGGDLDPDFDLDFDFDSGAELLMECQLRLISVYKEGGDIPIP